MSLPTPGLAALPTRDAVREALRADGALSAMVKGVLEWVPEKQPYPFIDMGEAIETPANAHDRHGAEVLHTLHIWSKHRGYAEALTIAARVLQTLDHKPLTIVGHRWCWTRFVSLQTLTDPEPPGDIRHVPMTFRIGTEVEPT
ncbi:DUF3168 domain-containing protein [Streptomyces sp. NPDC006132]|uniref:DUF3168 domain-containing protein n=1 Tax=Streptomyces sp. NPDC006132 TaxID=3156732 RepID=UPI0033FFD976